eukprot:363303-Chlamydomonas_euryale.AAC.1
MCAGAGTIFAYGQTGTGKSFTMQGKDDPAELRGIIPSSFNYVFEKISGVESTHQYMVRASYIEIYNGATGVWSYGSAKAKRLPHPRRCPFERWLLFRGGGQHCRPAPRTMENTPLNPAVFGKVGSCNARPHLHRPHTCARRGNPRPPVQGPHQAFGAEGEPRQGRVRQGPHPVCGQGRWGAQQRAQ